jgi:hypothetical protein
VFLAKTQGDLDALLVDLPAIDLYQLPSASIRPTAPGSIRRHDDANLVPRRITTWLTWTAASTGLLAIWLGIAIVIGGTAWLPWFLLIVIPWALAIARRPPDHL